MNDAYGDGWNGGNATFTNGLGEVIGFFTLDGVNDDGATGTATLSVVAFSDVGEITNDGTINNLSSGGDIDNLNNGVIDNYGSIINDICNSAYFCQVISNNGTIYNYGSISICFGSYVSNPPLINPLVTLDVCGVCGGAATVAGCTDTAALNYVSLADCDDGSCILEGCTDTTACNYDGSASVDDGACTYPEEEYLDCNGDCLFDLDEDGICDENEAIGCTDSEACNYNPEATEDDGACTYVLVYEVAGSLTPGLFESESYAYYETEGSTYEWSCTGGVITSGNGSSQVEVTWAELGVGSLCVVETNTEGCVGEEFCVGVAVIPTDIERIAKPSISIFPNPSSSSFTIASNTNLIGASYGLYTEQGRLVLDGTIRFDNTLVQTQGLSSGSYTLTINNSEQVLTETIVLLK